MNDVSKGKAAGPEQSDRVRELVRRLRDEQFGGSATETAKAIGVSAPALSDLLSGKRGPGMQMLEGIRDLTGMSLDQIVYGKPGASPAEGVVMGTWSTRGVAAMLKGWDEAQKVAKADHPGVPGWAWEVAATMTMPPGAEATPELAADLAMLAWRYTGPEERARRESEAQAKGLARLRGVERPTKR